MKKLFSVLTVFTFALALMGFVAPKVSAAALTGVTDTPSSFVAGTASTTHTVVFTTATATAVKSVEITFPAGFNIASAALGAYTPANLEATPVLGVAGQVATITFGTASAAATATYTIALTGITNTSTSGNATVSITTKDGSAVTIDGPTSSGNVLIVPAAISNLTCEASGQGGAVWLRWTTPVGTSAGYNVQYIQGNSITWSTGTTTFTQTWASGTVGISQQQLLTGLNPNTQYTFAMKAAGGNSSLSAVSTLTPICYAPGGARANIDTEAPVTRFVSPTTNAYVLAGEALVIKGVSKDVGGSSVQKVELSLDNGVSWNLANSLSNDEGNLIWSYTWASPTVGDITVQARAYDWVGNIETAVSLPIRVVNSLPVVTPATPAVPTVTPAIPAFPAKAVRHAWGRNLKFGDLHDEILELQKFLNDAGYTVSSFGPGSKGNETKFFGIATRKALMQYQKDHGLPSTGFFGPMTRTLLNQED